MKVEVSPKTAGIVIAVVVLIVVGVYFMYGRGQADRSGPLWTVDMHSPNGMKPPAGSPGAPGARGGAQPTD